MPLDKQSTTLRQAPYYDDYDETKNFHRVLFKPSVAIQARELTQLQTILQNQIERFGDNIYQTGTIIKGCSLTVDDRYYYAKLFDLQPSGATYAIAALSNTYVVDTATGLKALVVNYAAGGQQLDPDLNTIYFKYLNTGTGGQKEFSNNTILTSYNRNYRVESIEVVNGGLGYSNTGCIVVFTGTSTVTATATITTDVNGTIQRITITNPGSGYLTAPAVSIANTTGGTAGIGSGASLVAYNYLAQVRTANSLYTAGGTSTPIGRGTAIRTTEGIVYQKGHFVRVDTHETVLSKYDVVPTGVAVGFVTTEAVVNSNSDQTLLDNAGGTTNYTAPGADRLKLTATLTVLPSADAVANNQFLSLYEFEDGRVVKDRTQTQFNSVGKELARRTYEESGNYVVSDFPMYTEAVSGNADTLSLNVGAGTAYVQGTRVQLVNNTKYTIDKGLDTQTSSTQTVSTNYGGYVVVNEYMGRFDVTTGKSVALYNDTTVAYGRQAITASTGIGSPSGGAQIGTARVRSIVYDSGTPGSGSCRYRLYLFDVIMSAGYSFRDVRTVYDSGTAVADVVWDTSLGYATQYDSEYDSLIFDTGTFAVKQLEGETIVSRGSLSGYTIGAPSGSFSITLSGNTTFPYTASSTLNSIQKRDFIVVPHTDTYASPAFTGNIAVTSTSTSVVGTNTKFSLEYSVGDFIKVGEVADPGEIRSITSITSNTLMTVSAAFTVSNSNITHRAAYPANVPINMSDAGKSIILTGSDTATVSIGAVSNTAAVTVYYDYKQTTPALRQKSANTYYSRASNTAVTANPNGPWCLGIPDVVKLTGVYVGTDSGSNSGYEAALAGTNRVADFVLDNGQTDNFYGLAYVKKKPGSTLTLAPSNCLVFKFKALQHSTGSYLSAESYTYGNNVIDDASTVLPDNRIRTQDIPVFVSPKTGKSYDLRDVIDFRPVVANTAVYTSVMTDSTINPDTSTATKFDLGVDKKFPSPTREFEASIESYLARKDRVVIDSFGQVRVLRGFPSNTPFAPAEPEGAMTIGVVTIPQFPSLSAKDAADAGRPDLGAYVTPQQNRRYTMKDISDIETRIGRLEYYTLLNTLETNTKQLVLPSEANTSIERFKNGFFVDPLSDYNVSNIQDSEYKILIDTNKGVARPYFADTKIDLKFDSTHAHTSNVVQTGDLLTLAIGATDKVLLSQPIASRDRPLVDQQWRYSGKVKCVPAFDNYYDLERKGVSIAIDIASPLNALAKATSAALSELKVSTSLLSTVNVGSSVLISSVGNASGGTTETYSQKITKTLQDTKVMITGGSASQSNSYIGDYVNDVSLKEFVREQRINFIAVGLRPGATHHVLFDHDNMDARVTPCSLDLTIANPEQSDFIVTGSIGQALVANSTGCVAGSIDIPGGTYFVGNHSVVVLDVDNAASESTATSKSIGEFIGFTHEIAKTALTVSTKSVTVAGGDSGYGSKTYLGDPYPVGDTTTWTRDLAPAGDPLSQTFRIQPQLADTDGIFVTSVDLFFKQKDPIQGVTVAIHETTNEGTPSQVVVPFSTTSLPSSAVNVSNNATSNTRFTFPSPVYLKTDGTYALVVSPHSNSPDYRVFTAVVGEADVANTSLVSNQNWGLGTLFYSTTGSAWSAVQDEDLKFTLNRAEFTSTSGKAVLTNADYEFVTIANDSAVGTFRGGEDVAQLHPNTYVNGVVSSVVGNNTLTTATNLMTEVPINTDLLIIYGGAQTIKTANAVVVGTTVTAYGGESPNFSGDYKVGQFVKFGNSSAGEIRQVLVANSSQMTIDAPLNITATNVQHYLIGSPTFQIAKALSANSSSITLNKPAKVSTSSTLQVTMQKAVVGKIDSYNYSENRIYIANSTSSATEFKMYPANTVTGYRGLIVGDTSQAQAQVASLDNVAVNFFRPVFSTIVTPGTGITMQGTTTKSNGTSTSVLDQYELGTVNRIPYNDYAVIMSKSNELVSGSLIKSFTIELDMSSSDTDISPVLDVKPTSIVVTRNIVDNNTTSVFVANTTATSKNVAVASTSSLVVGMGIRGVGIPADTTIASIANTTTFVLTKAATATSTNIELQSSSNETSRYGINKSKYISKRLELADGMDAEDVKVFITAYKPVGTAVDVYAKVLNSTDGDTFDNKDWSLLSQVTSSSLYSDSLNPEDYREYEYTFSQTPPSTILGGIATAANTSDTLASVAIANTTGLISCTSTANLVVGSAITVTGANATAITGYSNPTTYRVDAVANATHFVMTTTGGTTLTTTVGTPSGLTFTAPAAIIGVDTAFTTNLQVGDLIKVVKSNATTDYDVAQVATIVSDTILYTTMPTTFRSNGCVVEKIDQPKAAFKYNRNAAGNIVRYYNASGTPFDTYKYLALKIVLRSQYNYLVPALSDIRALAVSI